MGNLRFRARLLPALFLFLALAGPPAARALPAFPSAEGFGTQTPGGRDGRVIYVENLNDDGPGSLRAALTAQGKRIVVFRTGGMITLRTGIAVSEPFLTVAGQTAPGDGICVRGAPELTQGLITLKANNVVIRGLRLRAGGDGKPPAGDNRDSLAIGTGGNYSKAAGTGRAHDIVVDRCSISWGVDENVQFWYRNRDVTVQHCIISEGLHYSIHPKSQNPPPRGVPNPQSHSFGLLIGGGGTKNVSLHHNLFAHNYGRNPRVDSASTVEILNNVVYDWGFRAVDLVGDTPAPMFLNIIGNFYKPTKGSGSKGSSVFVTSGKTAPGDGSGVYLSGNLDGVRTSDDQDAWDSAVGWTDRAEMTRKYRKDAPAFPPSGVTLERDARAAYERVLTTAGAIPRDAVDRRVVDDVQNGTGKWINSVAEVGGWPEYARGTAPADGDDDGMPDAWEQQHGLDPKVDDSAGTQLSREGYTNVEVYVNGLFGGR